jgi:hypothetical protein
MKRIALALAFAVALTGTSFAASYQFTVVNKSGSDIAKFYVRGGEIEGSTRVPNGGERKVKVTLPGGKCRAEVRIDFVDQYYIDDDKVMDFCKYGSLIIN